MIRLLSPAGSNPNERIRARIFAGQAPETPLREQLPGIKGVTLASACVLSPAACPFSMWQTGKSATIITFADRAKINARTGESCERAKMQRLKDINEQIRALEQERDQLLIASAEFQPGDVVFWQDREDGPVHKGRIESIRAFDDTHYEYVVYQIRDDGSEAESTTAISYTDEVWQEG